MLRTFESVSVAYFAYIAVTALIVPVEPGVKLRTIGTTSASVALVVAVAWASSLIPSGWLLTLRDGAAPPIYLILSYWLPARLVTRINPTAERALLAWDRRWGLQGGWRAPRLVRELAELAYLFCYPMIPAGFGVLVAGGFTAAVVADRYWTALLCAGAGCYGVLPWMATRPPREIDDTPSPTATLRAINLAVLARASVQLNTCPSGHVATAVAVALVVGSYEAGAGLWLGALAILIMYASVAGRYHYLADVVAGILVGLAAFGVSGLV